MDQNPYLETKIFQKHEHFFRVEISDGEGRGGVME
jgi:hypothetical protein